MKYSIQARPPILFTAALLIAIMGSILVVNAAPSTGPIIELPAGDREALDKYLGKGVVGKAVEAKPIDDVAAFMGLADGISWRYRVVHGKRKGKTGTASLRRDTSGSDGPGWSFDTGDDLTMHGAISAKGDMENHADEDRDQKVISKYTPPEPIIVKGMKPGATRRMTIKVDVYDLDRPTKREHQGSLNLTYEYVGVYVVTVPAGTFEASLFKWTYKGKVGPAKIEDVQYWFYAEGVGPVAKVEKKDVSAFLVYQDHPKVGVVLVERVQSE